MRARLAEQEAPLRVSRSWDRRLVQSELVHSARCMLAIAKSEDAAVHLAGPITCDSAEVRLQHDSTVIELRQTRQQIACLERKLRMALADNQRLTKTNQTNATILDDVWAHL